MALAAAARGPETGPAPALDKTAGGLLGRALELPLGRLSQPLVGGGLDPKSRLGPDYKQPISLRTLTRAFEAFHVWMTTAGI